MRSDLYRAARVMGDVEAAEKGPTAFGKRVVRRKAYRRSNALTRQVLRMVGLSR